MSAAKEWVLPPGYRALHDIVQEYGRDHAQTKLISRQWQAFKLYHNSGDLEPIHATTWCVARGRTWLEAGSSEWTEFLPGEKFGLISYVVIVLVSGRQPPWMDNPKDADGPKVRLAKELMDAAFPQGEWRQMGVRTVRKGCEQEAKTRRVQLPSPDSFSRAMGRRRK